LELALVVDIQKRIEHKELSQILVFQTNRNNLEHRSSKNWKKIWQLGELEQKK
jgi:hypothetical protein